MKNEIDKETVIFVDKIKVVVNKDNTIYVKKCIECGKKLTMKEASYGHDCE
jgi:hypothetical protein